MTPISPTRPTGSYDFEDSFSVRSSASSGTLNDMSDIEPPSCRIDASNASPIKTNRFLQLNLNHLDSLTDENQAKHQENALALKQSLADWSRHAHRKENCIEAAQRIYTAYLTSRKELDLSNLHLRSLPPELSKLTHLTKLYLNNNPFFRFPREVLELVNLRILYMLDCNLEHLPNQGFSKLTQLTTLTLASNRLTNLPPDFTELRSLKELALGCNKFSKIPALLETLPNLESFFALGNPLEPTHQPS